MTSSYVAVGPICASSSGSGGNVRIRNSTAYRALQLGIRALPTVGSLLWPKSSLDKNYFVVTKLDCRRVGIFLLLTLALVRTSVVSVLFSSYPLQTSRISSVWSIEIGTML